MNGWDFWVLTRFTLKGAIVLFRKEIWWKQLEKRRLLGGILNTSWWNNKFQSVRANFKHNLKWCHCEWFRKRILSKWSDISGLWMIGVYRNLSRTALDVEKSKSFIEMRKFRVQLYKSTILKPYFENIPTIDLGIFSGLITLKVSSLVVSLYVFLRRKWRVIHLFLHPLVFWCISLYIHNTYTWNPNDTCFWLEKALFFGGVDLKKIEVIWLPGIYIYIHTPIHQYNIPHWCFVFFLQSSPFQLDLPKTRGDIWKLRLETSLLFWPSGGTFSWAQTPWYDDNCFRGLAN